MVNFFRWLIGFVQFRFEGGFADGFINECRSGALALRDVRFDSGVLTGKCAAYQYLEMCRVAKRHGGRVHIIRKQGVVFPFLKIKNRLGLFVGAVCFAVIISFLSGFVWNIEIVGNERIKDIEIAEFLNSNGLSRGVWWDSVDKDRIENLMMASFEDCAWVHINESGTTARVEINETKKQPRVVDAKGFYNLRATDDGIIVKATVYDGWQVAKKGDAVTKGDLLISGVYDSEKKKGNQFAHARGEYIARVRAPFKTVVSRTQKRKSYTDEDEYKTLLFYGLKIPLYIGAKNLNSADMEESVEYLEINGNEIPIGTSTVALRRYTVTDYTLNDRELTALCKSEIDKKIKSDFSDCEVISDNIKIALGADSAEIKGTVTVLKDIGVEKRVKIKNNRK